MVHRNIERVVLAVFSLLMATVVVAQDRPKVVAVNYPLQYFAERLLGGSADVVFPVPEGVDPSFWRPSISDISMIQSADLILLNGAGFATWVDRVTLPRSRLVNTSAAIEDQFIVTESITHSHGDGGEHSHEGLASYVWLDPGLAIMQAEAIAEAVNMRSLAPPEEVEARLNDLRAELEALDQHAQDALSGVQNGLIATHPRYQYLAHRYDLTIDSLEWEAGAAPSSDQVSALETLMENTNATILIWEAEPPVSAVEAVSDLGLQSVVFPTLAQRPSSGDFISDYKEAVSALSSALQNVNN